MHNDDVDRRPNRRKTPGPRVPIDAQIEAYRQRKKYLVQDRINQGLADKRKRELAERPPNPCNMVLTGNIGAPVSRGLQVRCHCMAYPGASLRYFRYDILGIVGSIRAARELWDSHKESLKEESA